MSKIREVPARHKMANRFQKMFLHDRGSVEHFTRKTTGRAMEKHQ